MKKTFKIHNRYSTSGITRAERSQNVVATPYAITCTAVTNSGNTYEAYAEAKGGDIFDEEFGKVLTSTKIDIQAGEDRITSLIANDRDFAIVERRIKIARRKNAKKLIKAYAELTRNYNALDAMTGEKITRRKYKAFGKAVCVAAAALDRINAEEAAENIKKQSIDK